MAEVNIKINGKSIKAQEGWNVLQAALKNGIEIPNLCYNEQLEPYGACRFCMVEITAGTRKRLVASCCYLVEEGLIVETETPRVVQIRKMLVELMMARSPAGEHVKIAEKYGIKSTRFPTIGQQEFPCTLCGLCVRYCDEISKNNVVTFMGRGIDRRVTLVEDKADNCVMCRKCFNVCDAGGIVYLADKLNETKK